MNNREVLKIFKKYGYLSRVIKYKDNRKLYKFYIDKEFEEKDDYIAQFYCVKNGKQELDRDTFICVVKSTLAVWPYCNTPFGVEACTDCVEKEITEIKEGMLEKFLEEQKKLIKEYRVEKRKAEMGKDFE